MITSGGCISFFVECFDGVHGPDDTYKVALYDGTADLGPQTTRYTTAGEAKGAGYEIGGVVLTGRRLTKLDNGAALSFNPVVIPKSTLAASGALVYNASKGNRAVAVADFGGEVRSTRGPFEVNAPDDGAWVVFRNCEMEPDEMTGETETMEME